MQVTERMQTLGEHAKSSRQPPLKERKSAKADASAAKQDVIDESILENGAARDSVVAALVDEVTTQIVEGGNDNSVAEIPSGEDAGQVEPQPAAAKRAIIHEWENWSALHSDELDDPNVAEYFFRHLEAKKPHLLKFSSKDKREIIQMCLID